MRQGPEQMDPKGFPKQFHRVYGALFLFFFLFLAGPALAQEQICIQSGLNGNKQLRAADATLQQGSPTTKNGSLTTLTVSSSTAANQRSLVQFDLSPLTNAGIKKATMVMHVITAPVSARTYQVSSVTSFWNEPDVSWNDRVATVLWTTSGGGGDFNGTATSTSAVNATSTTASFDITADVEAWFNGSTNYGEIIADTAENHNGAVTTVFGSKETSTAANLAGCGGASATAAPELDVTYLQNVQSLKAAPGNASITVSWTIPAQLANSTFTAGDKYTGVVIVRNANVPIVKSAVLTDGQDPGLCATVGNGVVVFDNAGGLTSFADNGACSALVNGTPYFYKVFLRDSNNNYSDQNTEVGASPLFPAASSAFTEEISATPNTTAATTQATLWIAATEATNTLAAPSLDPGDVVMFSSGASLLFGIDANTNSRRYAPVSLSAPVDSRSSVIDSLDSSLGQNVMYVADTSGLVYAVNTDTGKIVWVTNPNATANLFAGGLAVELASINKVGLTHDLVVMGTDNATTTGNQVIAIDTGSGAAPAPTISWTLTGNTGTVPPMDKMVSTPLIDYVNSAIWVTTCSAGGTTCNGTGNAQPSLWKLNLTKGTVLLTENLGDIDSSPVLSFPSDVLFTANTAGKLFAVNPVTGATLASFVPTNSGGASGDGDIVGFPIVIGFASPYTVVFSGTTQVHAVTFNKATNTFTALWQTTIDTPSAPVGTSGLSTIYVGANDGLLHEIVLATGKDDFDMNVNLDNGLNNLPAFVGDPSLDVLLSRIYVTTNDQRGYAFVFPF
jgi:hypothetical protein